MHEKTATPVYKQRIFCKQKFKITIMKLWYDKRKREKIKSCDNQHQTIDKLQK